MLDRRWLHGGRRLTVVARITGSIPTLLRAWTGNPWSCSNHFNPLSVKEITEFKESKTLKILYSFPTDGANWWCFNYQWVELSSMLPIKGSLVNPETMNSKVRGDRWRPAKNPPMAKLVSLWFFVQESESVWMVTFFVDQCFYSTPTEQSFPFM